MQVRKVTCDDSIDISEDDEGDVAQSSDIHNPTTKEALAAVNVYERTTAIRSAV